MKHTCAAWLLGGLMAVGAAAHAADMADREFSLLLGGGWADGDLTGSKDSGGDVNPLFGLRYGQRLGSDVNLFGDLVYGPYDGDRAGVGDADVTTLRGGLEWLFSKQDRYDWFLSGGLGVMNVNTDDGPDFTRPMASLGIGQSWEVGVNDAFRWEVRADQSFGNDTLPNAALTNFQALLGYSWGIGAPPDSDGDGVPNRFDQCPNTPKGAKVDSKGCPLDSDGDGVFDGLDKCPDTPAGVKVNADGCPLDTDGDGIPDYQDKCPTVPAPGTADGCPPVVEKPAEPAPAPAPAPAPLMTLGDVHFDFGKATLKPTASEKIDNAVAHVKKMEGEMYELRGYTDSVGSEAYNMGLSQRRADAVRDEMIKRGAPADRIKATGYGEADPVGDNATKEGRAKNRRVELYGR
jgi:OOP family OmpA-OmpF porin